MRIAAATGIYPIWDRTRASIAAQHDCVGSNPKARVRRELTCNSRRYAEAVSTNQEVIMLNEIYGLASCRFRMAADRYARNRNQLFQANGEKFVGRSAEVERDYNPAPQPGGAAVLDRANAFERLIGVGLQEHLMAHQFCLHQGNEQPEFRLGRYEFFRFLDGMFSARERIGYIYPWLFRMSPDFTQDIEAFRDAFDGVERVILGMNEECPLSTRVETESEGRLLLIYNLRFDRQVAETTRRLAPQGWGADE